MRGLVQGSAEQLVGMSEQFQGWYPIKTNPKKLQMLKSQPNKQS